MGMPTVCYIKHEPICCYYYLFQLLHLFQNKICIFIGFCYKTYTPRMTFYFSFKIKKISMFLVIKSLVKLIDKSANVKLNILWLESLVILNKNDLTYNLKIMA